MCSKTWDESFGLEDTDPGFTEGEPGRTVHRSAQVPKAQGGRAAGKGGPKTSPAEASFSFYF